MYLKSIELQGFKSFPDRTKLVFDNGMVVNNKHTQKFVFEDLDDAQDVYRRVQKVILDIQTDMEFPNAYRPGENPGYNTQYRP